MNKRSIMIGGLLAVLLVGTLGAVLTTAQSSANTTSTQDPWHQPRNTTAAPPMERNHGNMTIPRGVMRNGFGFIPPGVNLTTAQWTELNATIVALREQNATFNETKSAIYSLLDSWGVYDASLSTSITQTQRRLTILQREQELRTQGYNWTTIQTMITQEFGQDTPTYNPEGPMMSHDHGFGCPGPGGRPED